MREQKQESEWIKFLEEFEVKVRTLQGSMMSPFLQL